VSKDAKKGRADIFGENSEKKERISIVGNTVGNQRGYLWNEYIRGFFF
jgi:hypothetical protein